MNPQFRLFPEQASATAVHLDHLTLYLLIVATFFSTLIFALIFVFAVKYRRRSTHERVGEIGHALPLEIAWSVIPFRAHDDHVHLGAPACFLKCRGRPTTL